MEILRRTSGSQNPRQATLSGIAIILVLTVSISVSACGGRDDGNNDDNEDKTSNNEEDNGPQNNQTENNPTADVGDPDSFSLSREESVVAQADGIDGKTTKVTIRLAGNLNNPAVPPTTVYFTTEGGNIESSCTTTDGKCSVTWESSRPRLKDGRATILAYAQGAESFKDLNSNGFFDGDDKLTVDLREAFRDDNENGARDLDELFVQYPTQITVESGSDAEYDTADGKYAGPKCQKNCADDDGVFIFTNTIIVMGANASPGTVQFYESAPKGAPRPCDTNTSKPGLQLGASASEPLTPDRYCAVARDGNGNPMPDGSSITLDAGAIDSTSALDETPASVSTIGSIIPFVLSADDTSDSGTLQVTVEPDEGASALGSIETQD